MTIIEFPGNARPTQWRPESATVIILPVIKIERYPDQDDAPRDRLFKRRRRRRRQHPVIDIFKGA